jgi:hypothetical protein
MSQGNNFYDALSQDDARRLFEDYSIRRIAWGGDNEIVTRFELSDDAKEQIMLKLGMNSAKFVVDNHTIAVLKKCKNK